MQHSISDVTIRPTGDELTDEIYERICISADSMTEIDKKLGSIRADTLPKDVVRDSIELLQILAKHHPDTKR